MGPQALCVLQGMSDIHRRTGPLTCGGLGGLTFLAEKIELLPKKCNTKHYKRS